MTLLPPFYTLPASDEGSVERRLWRTFSPTLPLAHVVFVPWDTTARQIIRMRVIPANLLRTADASNMRLWALHVDGRVIQGAALLAPDVPVCVRATMLRVTIVEYLLECKTLEMSDHTHFLLRVYRLGHVGFCHALSKQAHASWQALVEYAKTLPTPGAERAFHEGTMPALTSAIIMAPWFRKHERSGDNPLVVEIFKKGTPTRCASRCTTTMMVQRCGGSKGKSKQRVQDVRGALLLMRCMVYVWLTGGYRHNTSRDTVPMAALIYAYEMAFESSDARMRALIHDNNNGKDTSHDLPVLHMIREYMACLVEALPALDIHLCAAFDWAQSRKHILATADVARHRIRAAMLEGTRDAADALYGCGPKLLLAGIVGNKLANVAGTQRNVRHNMCASLYEFVSDMCKRAAASRKKAKLAPELREDLVFSECDPEAFAQLDRRLRAESPLQPFRAAWLEPFCDHEVARGELRRVCEMHRAHKTISSAAKEFNRFTLRFISLLTAAVEIWRDHCSEPFIVPTTRQDTIGAMVAWRVRLGLTPWAPLPPVFIYWCPACKRVRSKPVHSVGSIYYRGVQRSVYDGRNGRAICGMKPPGRQQRQRLSRRRHASALHSAAAAMVEVEEAEEEEEADPAAADGAPLPESVDVPARLLLGKDSALGRDATIELRLRTAQEEEEEEQANADKEVPTPFELVLKLVRKTAATTQTASARQTAEQKDAATRSRNACMNAYLEAIPMFGNMVYFGTTVYKLCGQCGALCISDGARVMGNMRAPFHCGFCDEALQLMELRYTASQDGRKMPHGNDDDALTSHHLIGKCDYCGATPDAKARVARLGTRGNQHTWRAYRVDNNNADDPRFKTIHEFWTCRACDPYSTIPVAMRSGIIRYTVLWTFIARHLAKRH